MNKSNVTSPSEALRELHGGDGLLVVPNAFDAGSARVLQRVGFATIATSSAAMAWTAGARDGQHLSFAAALDRHARVAQAVSIPVSIDFEGGYLKDSVEIEDTVAAVVHSGCAGLNLEDTNFGEEGPPLNDPGAHAELIARARRAADRLDIPLFIIGRTDLFFRGVGPEEDRVNEAVRRLSLYADAGADCVFAPGLADEDDIAKVISAVEVPLNVMRTASTPDLPRLAELGVGRVTFGADFYIAALSAVEASAVALHGGDVGVLESSHTISGESLGAVAA